MIRVALAASVAALSLTACSVTETSEQQNAPETAQSGQSVDPMASNDQDGPTVAEDRPRPLMQAQVVLDRLGFTPGVVDGKMGMSTVNAIKGFQESRGLTVTGELDEPTVQALSQWQSIPATRIVTIPPEFASDEFVDIPEDRKAQAKLNRMGYESLAEKLAERFHTTEEVLAELNPELTGSASPAPAGNDSVEAPTIAYKAGMRLRVPNVGADQFDASKVKDAQWADTLRKLGVGTNQPTAASIEVDKSEQVLRVLGEDGKLLAQFTATMGSSQFPLPLGTWTIKGNAYHPTWHYDPALLANVPKSDPKLEIPPGPNNPVGVVWMDLSKEHYGIHGTDEPSRIGRAESNGCIRLTNWDAARLAQMIRPGTKAVFRA
ncbi:L,D-transpeptidase family protein [Sphingomonas xanthus]|uniref:Murein L,D-transpeptidase n=1 Tax=Sphingomonas xanthus TaxID=2594473 RepID=A0A516ITR2_9SPHN|nr:L,D-transpeptidase family protein [Sphingomonas xanthus]QDP20298.1 murein L,D-transpeptidase [Sphingomonas xanthus]